jgi:hypothetical protein
MLMEDDIEAISRADEIKSIEGKDICLLGRIATSKEAFRVHFERQGYTVINLTDFLMKEINNPRPTRRDLYDAGISVRSKYSPDILARWAVERIESEGAGKKFLILGCRHPVEVEYIRKVIPEIVVIGLFPGSEELIAKLKKIYPTVGEESLRQWLDWNDGKAADGYTNIRICSELCDILFAGIEGNIVGRAEADERK